MAIVKILPQFQSNEERNYVAAAIGLTLICAGYLSFVPPLVVYLGMADKLSPDSKLILRQFLNFMINVAIIMVLLTIPVKGVFLAPVIGLVAFIYVIINLIAVLNNTELSIPVFFEILKEPN